MVAVTTSNLPNDSYNDCNGTRTLANTQPFSQTGQFGQIAKLQRKTLLLLWHFLILSLLNAWYSCTSGTQKSFWNYVKKMTNCLHTLGKDNKNFFYWRKITYGLVSSFWKFQSLMEFRSFLEKKSWSATDTQKKLTLGSWCWHKRRQKEVSPKIQYLSKILWNCSIFIVSREKSYVSDNEDFSNNGLFWLNFICTSKMITIAYFTNDNLLHVKQRINRQWTYCTLAL